MKASDAHGFIADRADIKGQIRRGRIPQRGPGACQAACFGRFLELTEQLLSVTVKIEIRVGAGVTMRIKTGVLGVVLAGAFLLPAPKSDAQTFSPRTRVAQAAPPADVDDVPAPRRIRRPLIRVPVYPRPEAPDAVYPRYNPGPNAVRECSTSYVQENRPSGPVITPRLNCFWRRG